MKSHVLNNHEASLLFSLRSRTTKQFKANFPYNSNQMCPLGCDDLDTPGHCLVCRKITPGEMDTHNTKYDDIFRQNVLKPAALSSWLCPFWRGGRMPVSFLLVLVAVLQRTAAAVNQFLFDFNEINIIHGQESNTRRVKVQYYPF